MKIELITQENACDTVKPLLDQVQKAYGFVPNIRTLSAAITRLSTVPRRPTLSISALWMRGMMSPEGRSK